MKVYQKKKRMKEDCMKIKGKITHKTPVPIVITNIRSADHKKYDEVWGIVSFMSPANLKYYKQVRSLAPSVDLFSKFTRLKENNNWNIETFNTIYKPQFLKEMQSEKVQASLKTLAKLYKSGERICLFCYCSNVELCHRKLIANLLEDMGVEVILN